MFVWKYHMRIITGFSNGSVPYRHRAIIKTNDDYVMNSED